MLLEVRDLRVHYHTSRGAVQAVNGVSFAIREGGRTVGAGVVSEIIEALKAQIRSCLEVMLVAKQAREVVDELVIGLIAVDREVPGVADNRP